MRLIARSLILVILASVSACGSMEASDRSRSEAQRSQAGSEQQQIVDKARLAVEAMKTDPAFGTGPDLLRRARAVLIVPNLIKGGFFVGGEGGQGVLLVNQGGTWSYPAFEQLFSASFGLQIGLEQAQLVMFVMSDKALQGLLQNEFKIGAQAGISVLMVGSNVQGATTSNLNADLIVWAKSQGAYAGFTLEGSAVKPNAPNNRSYYGRNVTSSDIVLKSAVSNAGADPLRQSLAIPR